MGARHFFDGLIGALGGAIGYGQRNFGAGNAYCPDILDDTQIDSRFRGSWLMRKIITKPATEITREGRDWQADKADIEKLEAEEKRLGLKAKLHLAEIYRGTGGAGMVLYIRGDDQMSPIDPKRIATGGLTATPVWHRSRFTLGPEITDWSDPYLGHPSYYEMGNVGPLGAGQKSTRFHPSRVVAFRGRPTGGMTVTGVFADRWWWGDSMVEIVREAVDNVHTGETGFAGLIRNARNRRLSVPGLYDRVSTAEKEAQFAKRVQAIAIGESNHSITWLDGGDGEGKGAEKMEDQQLSWAGIPEIKASNLAVAAAAANMPATVLLGKSPDGQNSTGASDQRLWEQEVKSRQDLEHRPCLDQLDVALIPSALGRVDPSIWWQFAPLSVPTEAEEATTFKTTMEAVEKAQGSNLIPTIAMEKAVQNLFEERAWLPGMGDALADMPEDERFPSLAAPDEGDDTDPSALTHAKGGDPDLAGSGGADGSGPARRANLSKDAWLADATPRPLYVQRKLLNADELIAWAKENGFETTLPASDMHVTVLYSRAPVDPLKMGEGWDNTDKGHLLVKAGGPRAIERLGENAVVLLFASWSLVSRHEQMVAAGASHDWPEYQPHVTLSYTVPEGVDLDAIKPFNGELRFGPEIFEALDLDWKSKIVEDGGAPTGDLPFLDAYNANQPRDERGRWSSVSPFAAHIRRARADGKEHSKTELGKVTEANAEHVRASTGVDISGHTRIAESSDIRHVFGSHGDPVKEAARKIPQIAVTEASLREVPNIIENAHTIRAIGVPGARKHQRLEYVATIRGHEFHYVEEIRPTKTIVALKTLKIVK